MIVKNKLSSHNFSHIQWESFLWEKLYMGKRWWLVWMFSFSAPSPSTLVSQNHCHGKDLLPVPFAHPQQPLLDHLLHHLQRHQPPRFGSCWVKISFFHPLRCLHFFFFINFFLFKFVNLQNFDTWSACSVMIIVYSSLTHWIYVDIVFWFWLDLVCLVVVDKVFGVMSQSIC